MKLWNGLELPDKNIYFKDDDVVIYCADCREILPELPKVDLVLTDPPYNIGIKYGENSSDKRDIGEYRSWLCGLIGSLESLSGNVFIFQSPKLLPDIADLFRGYSSFAAVRNFATMHGAGIPNAWDIAFYKCVSFSGSGRNWYLSNTAGMLGERVDHPTQKSLGLMRYVISLFNATVILDPFLGSGTTVVAAKHLNRKCIGIEIEERYCEIAVNRLRQSVMRMDV